VQVRRLWAEDGVKGGRAARKMALTDYFKALQALGVFLPFSFVSIWGLVVLLAARFRRLSTSSCQ
jgi:hypothetical protein